MLGLEVELPGFGVELLAPTAEELDFVVELLPPAVEELDCDVDALAMGMELLDLQSPMVERVCQFPFHDLVKWIGAATMGEKAQFGGRCRDKIVRCFASCALPSIEFSFLVSEGLDGGRRMLFGFAVWGLQDGNRKLTAIFIELGLSAAVRMLAEGFGGVVSPDEQVDEGNRGVQTLPRRWEHTAHVSVDTGCTTLSLDIGRVRICN